MSDAKKALPTGPLAGVRVIELAGIGPGPWAGMMLSDMGADVLRIDRPGGSGASVPPEFDVSLRGRRSAIVDLRSPQGVELLLDLVETADVLIEGNRPGVTERLGVGPMDCHARNPGLVYGRMTGWGQTGPLSQTAGHDLTYIAVTGALHAMGREGESPAIPLNLVGDYGGGGAFLVIGVLAALFEAQRSGRGQVVDAAIVDGTLALAAPMFGMLAAGMWHDKRGVNMLDGGLPWYDVYGTADGKHVAVGPLEPKFFDTLAGDLGAEDTSRTRFEDGRTDVIRAHFADEFVSETRDHWQHTFEKTDACVAPVLSLTEAAEHPHLVSRGSFIDVGGVRQPAPAPRFDRTPSTVGSPPAHPGQHSTEALLEWGIGADRVDHLIDSGVVLQQDRDEP